MAALSAGMLVNAHAGDFTISTIYSGKLPKQQSYTEAQEIAELKAAFKAAHSAKTVGAYPDAKN